MRQRVPRRDALIASVELDQESSPRSARTVDTTSRFSSGLSESDPEAGARVVVVKATRMKRTLTFVTLLLLGATVAEAQELEKSNPPALSKPAPGTYTHVVKAGKLLFIAGQTGVDAAGKVASPGMKEQLEQVMINLLAALKSQGADFSHVAKTTTFVTSISEFRTPEVAAVRAKYLGANPPANTLVQIEQLADPVYKVEIEAIAVLP